MQLTLSSFWRPKKKTCTIPWSKISDAVLLLLLRGFERRSNTKLHSEINSEINSESVKLILFVHLYYKMGQKTARRKVHWPKATSVAERHGSQGDGRLIGFIYVTPTSEGIPFAP